jgi:hypothetical protein
MNPTYEWTIYVYGLEADPYRTKHIHIRIIVEKCLARCVATSTALTTENTVSILLAACLLERVYRVVT